MKVARAAAVCGILFIMAALIAAPDRFVQSTGNGLRLWAVCVLPALFPFFFFTRLLTHLGAAEDFSRLLKKPTAILFGTPPCTAFIFAMSILCGYPLGARLISDMYAGGFLNERQAEKTASFAGCSGPMFIVGAVGSGMLGNQALGHVLLLGHYLGAILNGILWCRIPQKTRTEKVRMLSTVSSADKLLSDSLDGAVLSVLSVGGLIAVFSILIDLLESIGLFSLCKTNGALRAVMIGAIEMTRGCAELSALPLSPLLLASVGAVIAFGGLCVFVQAYVFLSACGIRAKVLLAEKLTQAVLTFGCTYCTALFL